CEACGGAMAGNTGMDTDSPRDSLLAAHTWVISPRVLNEARSQLPPSHLENLSSPPGIARWPASRRGEFPAERFKDYTGVYVFPRADWIQSYVQDGWKVLSNLTLDIGLRYESLYKASNSHVTFGGRERLRELIDPASRHDNSNWGPRFGLAWDVTRDNRTVVR